MYESRNRYVCRKLQSNQCDVQHIQPLMEEASKSLMEQSKQCLKPNHPTFRISTANATSAAAAGPAANAAAVDAAAIGKFVGEHSQSLYDENRIIHGREQ